MAAVVRELRDPAALGLALITGIVNWAIGVRIGLVALAILAVLGVRVVAGLLWQQVPSAGPPARSGRLSVLSPREMEVAALVAEGLRNKEIGRRLFLAERTVDNHVQHILNKLNLNNRAQIAAEYTRHQSAPK